MRISRIDRLRMASSFTEPSDPQVAGTRVHGLLSLCEPWQFHHLSQGAPWKARPDRGHVRLMPCPSLKDLDAALSGFLHEHCQVSPKQVGNGFTRPGRVEQVD